MVADLEHRISELRFLEGIEKAEHVPYPGEDQLWVRFNRFLDFGKLESLVQSHGFVMVRFAKIPSKLPRGLSEMLWDGVTHVVAKHLSGFSRFTSSLGFEPEGIAKIAADLHGPYQIFIATNEEGVQLLYEYLGLAYTPPAPPKPAAAPAKAPTPAAPKPVSPAPASTPRPMPASPSQQPTPVAQTPGSASVPTAQIPGKKDTS